MSDTGAEIHPGIARLIDRKANESDCAARHERSSGAAVRAKDLAVKNRERLISVLDDDGRGRLPEVEKDVEKLEEVVSSLKQQTTKQAVILSAVIGVATVAATLLAKLLIGG